MENFLFGKYFYKHMSLRAFIAVEIGPQNELVTFLNEVRNTGSEIKLVKPENIHITLKFLGNIDEGLVPEICRIITEASKNVEPFSLKLLDTGAFPNLNYIKVLWVGLDDPGPLPAISRYLNEKLNKLGFQKEKRSFKPHVTLGRVKSRKNKEALKKLLNNNQKRDFGTIDVDSIYLKKSVLSSEGPTYYTLFEAKLKNSKSQIYNGE